MRVASDWPDTTRCDIGRPELDALPAVCSLVADELTAPVFGMHSTIAARAFRYTPANDRLVHHLHDSVVASIYRAIPAGAAAAGTVAGTIWDARTSAERPVSDSSAGSRWQAVLNATWGDRLADEGSPLAVETSFRHEGRVVTPATVGSHLGGRRRHAVVLLHGLGQTESCWQSPGGLLEILAGDGEFLPVLVRYNSGRAVDCIGGEVAALIEAMLLAAPESELEVSLVGFSMGGLVARAAYAAMVKEGRRATPGLRHIITIGSPHGGSYLARFTRLMAAGLATTRTTKPLATFLDRRSAAIRDLEWATGAEQLPRTPGVQHHFAAATITGDRSHPVGLLFGDLVVRVRSATAPAIAVDNVNVVGGKSHVDLLADEEVQSRLIDWLRSSGGN